MDRSDIQIFGSVLYLNNVKKKFIKKANIYLKIYYSTLDYNFAEYFIHDNGQDVEKFKCF